MSQTQTSSAAVIRVKGVSFNFLQFMWSSYGQIKQVQAKKDYATALTLLTELIRWLPDSIKEQFRNRAVQIEESINLIKSGKLPQIKKIPDFYLRGIFKNRLLQAYCDESFKTLIDDLGTKLNALGYMENTKVVVEGTTDQEGSWIYLQDKEGKKGKRKKKDLEAPTGSME